MKRVVILGCILLLAFSSALLAGCGGSGGGGGNDEAQVKAVAEKFMEATVAFDAEALGEVITETDLKSEDYQQAKEDSKQYADVDIGSMDIKYEIGKVEIDGDEATVNASMSFGEEKSNGTIYLVKENGEWKVDLEKTNSEGSPESSE
ncbi:MAG: nuclear transport factor 2 family protein [Actinobacteria bacterium]|nr:nuclear transport factor 2 family protein [Actinomycetota bacterium]